MLIKVTQSTLVGGIWHEPGIGEYNDKLAEFLISLGVAERADGAKPTPKISAPTETDKPMTTKGFEKMVEKPVENKMMDTPAEKKISSSSQPVRASRKRTAKRFEDKDK